MASKGQKFRSYSSNLKQTILKGKRSKSECTLRSAAAAVKLDLDDSKQDTRETRKRKTQLPTRTSK